MRRISLPALLGGMAVFAMATLAGCGGGDDVVKGRRTGGGGGTGKTPEVTPELKAIEPKEYGTLSGTMTADKVPTMEKQEFTGDNKAQCAMGTPSELIKQTWIVNAGNKGIANVVVFLKAPKDSYFKLKPEDMKREDTVTLRQPHCAFVPHVVALFPQYYDPAKKELVPSGQKFKILNDAPFNHNSKFTPANLLANSAVSFNIPSGESRTLPLTPDPVGPSTLSCDIHPWMNAKAWIFDHPYAAVTDENGKFEIKNVPVGVDVNVVAWHEGAGFFHGGPGGTKKALQPKDTLDLTVPVK